MANHSPSHYPRIGIAGEDLVVNWLESQGWVILHRRWRYRRGEVDIIAQFGEKGQDTGNKKKIPPSSPLLAFVEVKTRSQLNWDEGGRSAITQQKQVKLWRTALMFLAQYPEKANYSCRFDVAIVGYQETSQESYVVKTTREEQNSSLGNQYTLILYEYIPAAFDCPSS
ncbi:YraN family protein [Scytonema sp. UIC 10036]|uniref:YraN family protein n=1 Tax=Scytonema sp. UIC 10036 TaxID=2304196 RepID=UPI0012DA3BAA|nr:YraN family protein [Scytonema sp. UIC 10036]MUH00934.1 YraN family protein [Scytonema sp. UIC 10036]